MCFIQTWLLISLIEAWNRCTVFTFFFFFFREGKNWTLHVCRNKKPCITGKCAFWVLFLFQLSGRNIWKTYVDNCCCCHFSSFSTNKQSLVDMLKWRWDMSRAHRNLAAVAFGEPASAMLFHFHMWLIKYCVTLSMHCKFHNVFKTRTWNLNQTRATVSVKWLRAWNRHHVHLAFTVVLRGRLPSRNLCGMVSYPYVAVEIFRG